jgi:erythromycin esterase-like protein
MLDWLTRFRGLAIALVALAWFGGAYAVHRIRVSEDRVVLVRHERDSLTALVAQLRTVAAVQDSVAAKSSETFAIDADNTQGDIAAYLASLNGQDRRPTGTERARPTSATDTRRGDTLTSATQATLSTIPPLDTTCIHLLRRASQDLTEGKIALADMTESRDDWKRVAETEKARADTAEHRFDEAQPGKLAAIGGLLKDASWALIGFGLARVLGSR